MGGSHILAPYAGAGDLKCEEADDRRVEEIARQLEEIEQADLYSSVSADLANNREHDDRKIEANVGGPPPSNIREYLDELTRSLALSPPIHPRALKTLYDRRVVGLRPCSSHVTRTEFPLTKIFGVRLASW
jgi:hypothetical protein